MATRRIVAVCSLCGHEYARWFSDAETAAHMAEAHGLHFVQQANPDPTPRPLFSLPGWAPLPAAGPPP